MGLTLSRHILALSLGYGRPLCRMKWKYVDRPTFFYFWQRLLGSGALTADPKQADFFMLPVSGMRTASAIADAEGVSGLAGGPCSTSSRPALRTHCWTHCWGWECGVAAQVPTRPPCARPTPAHAPLQVHLRQYTCLMHRLPSAMEYMHAAFPWSATVPRGRHVVMHTGAPAQVRLCV